MKVQALIALIALKADFPLPALLQITGLARSTFFYHQARLRAPDPRDALKAKVMEIFEKNHSRYGHRRIHAELVKQGWTIAKKTVLKLMHAMRLVCKVRRKKRYSSYKGDQGKVAPNVLNREFEADGPNRKWVTDVTEFRVGDRKLYLSPVMDLFDRQIISPHHQLVPEPGAHQQFAARGPQPPRSWPAAAGAFGSRLPAPARFLASSPEERRRRPIDVPQSQLL